jgi:hypothetical protein
MQNIGRCIDPTRGRVGRKGSNVELGDKTQRVWDKWLSNIETFVEYKLAGDLGDVADYVPGSRRVEFYAEKLAPEHYIDIEGHIPGPILRQYEYEEALLERLSVPSEFGMLLLVGGLGSGKSTTIAYLKHLLAARRSEVKDAIGCAHCSICKREPLVINCIAEGKEKTNDVLVRHIFREIRLAIYERLLRPWLMSGGLALEEIAKQDQELTVLRRLLLANDILPAVEHPFDTPIDTSELLLGSPLRSRAPTMEWIRHLITTYRGAAIRFQRELKEVAEHQSDAVEFMAQVLRTYMENCQPGNPLNLIVIDNLDQLPTKRIDVIVKRLHDAASRAPGVPFLVALRPSSIVPDGFVRTLHSRYHYGPRNAEVVAFRLWKYVLSQSRSDLARRRADGGAFDATPTDDEIDALLVAAWLYFRVATTSIGDAADRPTPLLEVHPDHAFLRHVDMAENVSRSLAWTLEALTGTCTRYALRELVRFFQNAYRFPLVLSGVMRRLRTDLPSTASSYGDLVYLVVAHAPGATRVNPGLANVFMPTERGGNHGSPSLVKLRLLEMLALAHRVRIRDLVKSLCFFGIPWELAVAGINDLQDRHRLLLWLSDNSRIEDVQSETGYAVVSEHGVSYFESVIGDFELSWYSAIELSGQVATPEALKFTQKLEAYTELVGRLVSVEWLQICFHRTLAQVFESERGELKGMPMISAAVMLASLRRTLASAYLAMKGGRVSQEFLERLSRVVGKLLDVVDVIEGHYKLAFGGVGLQSRYERQVGSLLATIDELAAQGSLSDAIAGRLRGLVDRWRRPPTAGWNPAGWLSRGSPLPEEGTITTIARLGRAFDALGSVTEALDRMTEAKTLLRALADRRQRIAQALEEGVPTYSEFLKELRFLLDDTTELKAVLGDSAATGTQLYQWARRERDELREAVEVLGTLRISVDGLVGRDEMSEMKQKSNRILDIYRAMAVHLGVRGVSHLEARWAV